MLKLLIEIGNVYSAKLTPSEIQSQITWLPERPEKIIQKGFFRKKIIIETYKPAGLYCSSSYDSPFRDIGLYIVDNNIVRTKPTIKVTFKDKTYQYFTYNSDEEAMAAFKEIKEKTNLFEI